ncbi:MAG: 30S ribosomal protein S12 methylthiotransferase RimO [Lentisphaeria bacterium]|nr:30S ribosomal protein S12 methylthiotransferase RimO [Lentisphaeria bacterium]
MRAKKQSPARNRGFFIAALGCPKNLVEAEIISGTMLTAGYTLCFTPEDADVYIVDTCAFLPAARSEAAGEIAAAVEWKRQKNNREIVVAGCLLNHHDLPDFRQAYPEVDIWVPVDDTANIPAILAGIRKCGKITGNAKFLADETLPRFQLTLPHIAYLKISDGCNNHCAYCAIPKLRGELRSRPMAGIVKEAAMLVDNGVKELIVIAQDVTAYGQDRPESGENLTVLLKALEAIPGDFKIRLLYTHPAHYTGELIAFLAASTKVMPYLDMPLQHISDRILKAMNRHIDRAGIENLLTKLRRDIPGLILRSTFITGLPGETEAEFNELYEFIKKWKFDRLGVFSFAPEPGTKAAEMPHQIAAEVADARAKKILSSQIARMKRAQKKLVGSTIPAVVDSVDENSLATARGIADAPEIDNCIYFIADDSVEPGMKVNIRITGVDHCDLTGELE